MIRLEFGHSVSRRNWRDFAKHCPRSAPIGQGVITTIDPYGVTLQSATNLDHDEYVAARFIMDWWPQVYGYHPLWILQHMLTAGVQ